MNAPTTNRARWGSQIRAIRRERLFKTQAELAEHIVALAAEQGIELTLDQSAISLWESGRNAPSLRARPFVARACGVPTDLLFQELPEVWVA